jgi:hypothetical protein
LRRALICRATPSRRRAAWQIRGVGVPPSGISGAHTLSFYLFGYRLDDGPIDERNEDEQIRMRCENLTARQRLKMYRQLYALGCRIDGIERSIEKLTARSRT